ncbi:MAG: hypothetical protein ACKO0Z_04755 [Betaproteobacteria bacterium]
MCIEISRKIVTARKRHQCDFCLGWIEKGEKYIRSTIVGDGQIWTWISHIECDKITKSLNLFDYFRDGIDCNSFQETINEYVEEHHSGEKEWNIPINEQVKMILKEMGL